MSKLAFVVLAGLLTAAAVGDVRRYTIPNWLCALTAAAGLVLVWPGSAEAWASRGASVGVMAAVGLGLWLARVLGGGDYKLLVGVACWIPFGGLLDFAVLLAVIGGLQAAATLIGRRVRPPREDAPPREAVRGKMPYGVSIAAAGILWAAMAVRWA